MPSEWPVERDGHQFKPLPESWLDHPAAEDPSKRGPRCLAVSCEIRAGRFIHVPYGHLISANVVETVGPAVANPDGERYVPRGLADGTGWPRSYVPSPCVDLDELRTCERRHLVDLWRDRLDFAFEYEREVLDEDPEERLIADGSQDIREWIRERIESHIDLEDSSEQTNPWSSKYHVRQDIQYHEFGRDEVVDEIEQMVAEGELIEWIGYVAPRREEVLRAIIETERQSSIPREILIGECNKALQELAADEEPTTLADGGSVVRQHERCVGGKGDQPTAGRRFEVSGDTSGDCR